MCELTESISQSVTSVSLANTFIILTLNHIIISDNTWWPVTQQIGTQKEWYSHVAISTEQRIYLSSLEAIRQEPTKQYVLYSCFLQL